MWVTCACLKGSHLHIQVVLTHPAPDRPTETDIRVAVFCRERKGGGSRRRAGLRDQEIGVERQRTWLGRKEADSGLAT